MVEFIIGCGIVVLFFWVIGYIMFGRTNAAKKKAKVMLATGKITDIKKTNAVLETLGQTGFGTHDLEAEELWKKLSELKAKGSDPI